MSNLLERSTIRQASLEDAKLISVLASATFYEAYFEQDESANLASYIQDAFDLEVVRSEITDAKSTFFVLLLNGMAVGYARLIAGSTLDCIRSTSSVIELKRIYLIERMWGTGLGKLLLEHCLNYAADRGFDALWLGVWDENVRAQSFYQKFGFREVGTIAFPYGDVVGTNLVLEKTL